MTHSPSQLCALGYAIGEYSCVQALDVLPYHSMGKVKYEALQIPYPLGDTREATKEEAEKARTLILAGMKKRRKL